jgi:2-haloacid dehalogenase
MLDFARFEILTFDCYGTLINWEAGILPVLQRILEAHGHALEDHVLLQLYGDFEQHAEQGNFQSYRQVLVSVVRQFGEELDFVPSSQEENSLPDSLAAWEPWPDTVPALRRLTRRFRVAILSNIDDDLFANTRPKLGIDLADVVTAQQAEAYKPSLKLFELALRRLNVPAHRILHVGQSIYHDVIPAQRLGMATVWVNRPSARPGVGAVKSAVGAPDLTATSLDELATLALAKL